MFPDINCDMGEGMAYDGLIMPFIDAASIACGFHAGNSDTIKKTIDLALEHQVKIGAHPSFRDKENFGRREMKLPHDRVYAIVIEQLIKVDLIAKEKGARLHHMKPHGALYNMAAKDRGLAQTLATVVKDFDEKLVVYGLSGSYLVTEAEALGLKVAHEAFADRTYFDDGSLVPRKQPDAVIDSKEQMIHQVNQLVKNGTVTTVSGKTIAVKADTICIHSDTRHAWQYAKALRELKAQIEAGT